MNVYFDTEFAKLAPDAALISIGLIDEAGEREFYAEAYDAYQIYEFSDFFLREVLPHLEGGSKRMPTSVLREALTAWLASLGPDVVLICDSQRDADQLNQLYPHGLPLTVRVLVIGWWANLVRRFKNRGRRIHRANGYRVHHALDDAKVNRVVLTGRWT